MKSTVAFRFAVPTRTLAVLVLGASLGLLPRVAHSQTALPNDEPAVVTAPTAPNLDELPTDESAPTVNINGAYTLNPPRPDGGNRGMRPNPAERSMRDMMARNGITVTTTQDAILGFLRDDEEGKKTVRDAGRRLLLGVRHDVPAERLRALLNDYQKALDTERKNRELAQTALDARVGYSLNPRLESLLWLFGVLGEGQNLFAYSRQGPSSRGPRMGGGGNNQQQQFGVFGIMPLAGQLQIEGIVNAKNSPQDTIIWLEIRDGNGRLWRMVPSNSPEAQPILNRQVNGLLIGTHVLARVISPAVMTPTTPYSLLALIPATDAGGETGEGGDEGAGNATDGQYNN